MTPLLLLPVSWLALSASPLDCPAKGTALVVAAREHRLARCEDGRAVKVHEVAIGSGGVAPKRVGWAQTPLGRFTLQAPRPSSQFHVFVPLENPDPKRFSAWAIGFHGPPRETKDAGKANVSVDWTLGCIAVSSDAEIDDIAAWVREKKVRRVEFR